jgi:hypothetical protein
MVVTATIRRGMKTMVVTSGIVLSVRGSARGITTFEMVRATCRRTNNHQSSSTYLHDEIMLWR